MASPPTGKDKGKTRNTPEAKSSAFEGPEKLADAGPSTDPSAAAPATLSRHHSESDPATQPLPETSTSDLGLLRLSEQISRNEERLKDVPLLGSTITDSQTLESIPSIGASPGMAMAPPGHSQEQSGPDLHPIPEGDSQLAHLSIDDLSTTHITQDASHDEGVLNESLHDAADVGNISAVSSAPNTSVEYHANTSVHSQASNHSSGSSRGNRSHDSQGSRVSQASSGSQSHSSGSNTSSLSFRGATTSTPQQTPQPPTYSQSTTPSDTERIDRRTSLESSHSQISPPSGGSAPTPVWPTSLSPDPQPFKSNSYPGANARKGRSVSGAIQTGVEHTVERGTGQRLATTSTTTSGITATAGLSRVPAPPAPADDFGSITDLPDDLKEEDEEDDEAVRRRMLVRNKGPLPPAASSSGVTSKEHALITIAEEKDEAAAVAAAAGAGAVEPGPAEHELGQRRSLDDPLLGTASAAGPSSLSGSPRQRPLHHRSDSGSSGGGHTNREKSRRVRRVTGGTSVEYVSSDDDNEPEGPASLSGINLNLSKSFRGMESYTSDTTSIFKGGKSRTASLPSFESGGGLSRAGSGLVLPEGSSLGGDGAEEDEVQVLEGPERESGTFHPSSEGSVGDVGSSSSGGGHGPSGSFGSRSRSLHQTRSNLSSYSSRSGPSSLAHESGELPSSQASSSSAGNGSTFIQRLKEAADEVEDPTVRKRRRTVPTDPGALHVKSSIGDEDGWDGSDRGGGSRSPSSRGSSSYGVGHHGISSQGSSGGGGGAEPGSLPRRSRSPSLDMMSYPDGSYSEDSQDQIPELVPLTSSSTQEKEEEGEIGEPEAPKTPTRPARRSSARLQAQAESAGASSSTTSSSQKSGISSRSPRKRDTGAPSTPSKQRTSQRSRVNKPVDALRKFKVEDPVWAKWNRRYYTGFVASAVEDQDKYDVRFLDNYRKTMPSSDMRPLKLLQGTEVYAQRSPEVEERAIVEGYKITEDLDTSRVDVRFEDETQKNIELWKINMTQSMFASLEQVIDWDKAYPMEVEKPTSAAAAPGRRSKGSYFPPLYGPSSPSSSSTAPASALEQPATPSRTRIRGAALQGDTVAPMTPTRRSKGNSFQFFRNYKFVLSMSGDGDEALLEKLTGQIVQAGGTVLHDFEPVISNQRDVQENVFLVTRHYRRTKKYLEALALNVPRVSHRWVEKCLEEHRVIPFQQFLLPTGYSRELQTVISSVPPTDRGIFHTLKIGICSTQSFWKRWNLALRYGGAEVVRVSPSEGAGDCNFIVFGGSRPYEKYLGSNPQVESLSMEWIIQCLINQRVVAIDGHPSHTTFNIDQHQDPRPM
ncbi:hypothetical protein BGZ73_008823 [Actinomortierella ambigua]|nr:hypothetical protein BGZ73_008823 [Actinomortierella ambigua]